MTLNQFQLSCRSLTARKDKTDVQKMILSTALGLVGESVEVMDLVDVLDPRYKSYSADLAKAAGKLAELVRDNVYHRDSNEAEIRAKVVVTLGRMLTEIALFADMVKAPLADVASAALKETK